MSLDLEARRKPTYQNDRIPIKTINVLAQPRKTFEDLTSLSESILDIGLMEPLVVARFDLPKANSYVDIINELWKTYSRADDLIGNNFGRYDILIAGERRLRAVKLLLADGSYQKRFGDSSIDVRLSEGIDPYEAIKMQAQENIHVRVPPAEEARFYNDFYLVRKRLISGYSMRQFAREVGRAPETVRMALKFCGLPEDVQNLVREKKMPYGIAVELTRLKDELNVTDETLQYWALRAMVSEFKIPDFRRLVTNYINEQRSGQTMFGLFTAEQEEQMRRAHIRKVVAEEFVSGVWNGIHYTGKLRKLLTDGNLDFADSPYSSRSPLRIYRGLVDKLREILPLVEEHLTAANLVGERNTLEQGINFLKLLQAKIAI